MLSFLIYILIQIILGFWFLAELLASSWNVAYKSLKYTSKLFSTWNMGFINLFLDFNLKPEFKKWNPGLSI